MRCSDCNGVIEGQRSFCPHCGSALSGVQRLRSHIEPPPRPAISRKERRGEQQAGEGAQLIELFNRFRAFVLRDTKTTVISGMVAGAIIGKTVGLGWIIGSVFGGFVTFKYLEKK